MRGFSGLAVVIGVAVLLVVGGLWVWPRVQGVVPAVIPPPPRAVEQLSAGQNSSEFPLAVADGIELSVFAEGLGAPRDLAFDPAGRLVASIPERGQVVAFSEAENELAAEPLVLLRNLDRPHGITFHCEAEQCWLYVAEETQVVRYTYDSDLRTVGAAQPLFTLPGGGRHWTRSLLIHDTHLWVSIGSSCDVCVEDDSRYAAVFVANLDGSNFQAYATGLRNAVFLAVRPQTEEVWVTEMGRDRLGDNLPPDEVNVLRARGQDYGWPYCYGAAVPDTRFSAAAECAGTVPAQIEIQAHSAPLGLDFVPTTGAWPQEYESDLLVAYHGSWNRTEPTGYKIVRFELNEAGEAVERHDFIAGWLTDAGRALGRPVDIVLGDDGVGYISDDAAGLIYRMETLPSE